MCLQVRGEAQALRSEMETQRNRATQLEQLFQQQVRHRFPPVPPPPPSPLAAGQKTVPFASLCNCVLM